MARLYDSRHTERVAGLDAPSPDRILNVPRRGTVRSAKTDPVIQTCKQCGAINQSSAENCCFCTARLSIAAEPAAVSVSNRPPEEGTAPNSRMDGSAATQAAWRSEVKNRVKTYRDRRRTLANDDSQTALEFEREPDEGPQADSEDQCKPEILSAGHEEYDQRVDHLFDEAADTAGAHDEEQYEDPLQATLAAAARMSHEESAAPEHVREEPLQQLMIDVSRPPEVEPTPTAEKFAISYGNIDSHLESTLFPVGDLRTRRRAGMLDAMALLLSYAAILGLFAAFGGRLAPVRLDAFICGSIAALLYVQYFVLFSMLGGATPGMMMTALRVVGFDGSAPKPRQLMMRGVGYVISGGMAMLGFLWAFWDEDHLSWHDRISQTYIISAEDLSKAISAAEAPDEPPLAQF